MPVPSCLTLVLYFALTWPTLNFCVTMSAPDYLPLENSLLEGKCTEHSVFSTLQSELC
jgi:hypothetical protein